MPLVARVLIDSPLPQLDRLFDYAIPPALRADAVPGVRVKVPLRTAGRVVEGYLVEVVERPEPSVAGKPLSDATLLKLVREQGYEVDIHGFRTSFRTWAQERTNFAREVAEAALAHTIKDKAEAAYARSELMEKRRALGEAWATYLAQESAKVVRIG